jgi:hypothetical protein
MNMKKARFTILILILLVSLSLMGCIIIAEDAGDIETRQFDFIGFTAVDIGSAFNYEIIQAESYAIDITADSDLFKYIEVNLEHNTLKIRFDNFPRLGFFNGTIPNLQARIAMPRLTSLEISGASNGMASGFTSADDLDVELSGASSLKMADMAVGDINLEISGSSRIHGEINAARDVILNMSGASIANTGIESEGNINMKISGASRPALQGSARNMQIEASGASLLEMERFEVHDAAVTLSGSSRGTIILDGRLDVELSGASQLYDYGEPAIGKFDISGGSEFRRIYNEYE